MSCTESLEAVEAAAAGVALVALHDRGPLVRGHGAGAGVGEQVDEHIVGGEQEKIVVRGVAAAPRAASRVVQRMGSTLLMRNGSMMVVTGIERRPLKEILGNEDLS